jgi:hypothetical protein
MLVEQAIYGSQDAGGYRFLARSPGFSDAWLADAERLCTAFGERPAGVECPLALFARPFGKRHVAVVQVADQGRDDAGRPGALAFRLLVLPARLYADLGGDPFLIADRFPPPWAARGELEALHWTAGPPPRRTTAELTRILNVEQERTQMLLGGVQVLIDGGRLVLVRGRPDERLVRDLWALLPYSSRTGLWPATFAFGNAHGFDVLVTPAADGPAFARYTREEQAGDYPEGQYELALQHAVEHDDQRELDALLSRRSRSQTLRLAVALFLVFAVMALVIHFPFGGRQAPEDEKDQQAQPKEPPPNLPLPEEVPSLGRDERVKLAGRLAALGKALNIELPAGTTEADLAGAITELDRGLDEKMGAKKPRRDPGKDVRTGPAPRRLRALLWKHGAADYDQPGLNSDEMVDRLSDRLVKEGVLKEKAGD